MVSHPETGLDSPIGSDRDRGRDRRVTLIRDHTYEESRIVDLIYIL